MVSPTMSAAPSRKRSSAGSSAACTRPRCRSGSSRRGSEGRQPSTGWANRSSQARRRSVAWRSLADAVEHHRRHLDVVAMMGEAFDQRRGGCAHALRIDHQDHRHVEQARQIGGRAVAVGGAVEQPHDAFAEHQIDTAHGRIAEPGQGLDPHRPAVQVEAGPTGRAGMKHRVEIVGADLERARPPAPAGDTPAAAPGSARSCRCPTPAPR